MQYYIIVNSQPQGPFELNELPSKGLTPDTMIWHEGMAEWQPVSAVPEVMALLSANAGTANVQPDNDTTYYLAVNGQHQGPYNAAQLREAGVMPSSLVWRQGMSEWKPISDIPELSAAIFGNDSHLYGAATTAAGTDTVTYGGVSDENPDNIHPLEEEVTECPSSHLALAIVAVILFFPLGIPALVKATLVNKRWAERRYGDAVWLSKTSKKLALWALYIGIAINAVYLIAIINGDADMLLGL